MSSPTASIPPADAPIATSVRSPSSRGVSFPCDVSFPLRELAPLALFFPGKFLLLGEFLLLGGFSRIAAFLLLGESSPPAMLLPGDFFSRVFRFAMSIRSLGIQLMGQFPTHAQHASHRGQVSLRISDFPIAVRILVFLPNPHNTPGDNQKYSRSKLQPDTAFGCRSLSFERVRV